MMDTHLDAYADRRVLITGGLGFIGSNLARRLVDLGSRVLLVDSLVPEYGGNRFNIAGIEDQVRVEIADVRDPHVMSALVPGHDVLFNLAGQVSHLDSMADPFTDLEMNAPAHSSSWKPAAITIPTSRSSTRARGKATAGRSICRWTRSTAIAPPTSTASTSWRANGITWSTATRTPCARAACA
jgi:hypothetical protein